VGDSDDNAMAESIIGHPQCLFQGVPARSRFSPSANLPADEPVGVNINDESDVDKAL
jgi:hypothetical protein